MLSRPQAGPSRTGHSRMVFVSARILYYLLAKIANRFGATEKKTTHPN